MIYIYIYMYIYLHVYAHYIGLQVFTRWKFGDRMGGGYRTKPRRMDPGIVWDPSYQQSLHKIRVHMSHHIQCFVWI